MTAAWCLVRADLSRAELSPAAGGAIWEAPQLDEDLTLAITRRRATDLAEWITRAARGRKLERIIADVDESLCVWTRAASTREPIVAATLKKTADELATAVPAGAAEVATVHHVAADGMHALTAIWHADGPLRLLLDQLDRRGVRPDAVSSLWQALAATADDPHTALATVVVEDHRTVWTWGHNACLLAGGKMQSIANAGAEHVVSRMAMDWLSWTAHLGVCPTEVRIVAAPPLRERADALVTALAARWQESADVRVQESATADLIDHAVANNRCSALNGITTRATRRDRRRLQMAAGALVLLAAGTVGLSVALFGARGDWLRETAEITRAARADAEQVVPQVAEQRGSLRSNLSTAIAQLEDRDPPELPPEPVDFSDAMERIVDVVAGAEGSPLLVDFVMRAQEGVALTVLVEDLEAAITLRETLREANLGIDWERPQMIFTTETRAVIQGRWTT